MAEPTRRHRPCCSRREVLSFAVTLTEITDGFTRSNHSAKQRAGRRSIQKHYPHLGLSWLPRIKRSDEELKPYTEPGPPQMHQHHFSCENRERVCSR